MVGNATLAIAPSITDIVMPSAMVVIAQYRWGSGRPSARSTMAIDMVRPFVRAEKHIRICKPVNPLRVPRLAFCRRGRSSHHPADAMGANARRLAVSVLAREENQAHATDQIFKGNIPNRRQNAAIGRVVAVVAQHEEITVRNGVDAGVVERTLIEAIERIVAHPVRQCFVPAFDMSLRRDTAGV